MKKSLVMSAALLLLPLVCLAQGPVFVLYSVPDASKFLVRNVNNGGRYCAPVDDNQYGGAIYGYAGDSSNSFTTTPESTDDCAANINWTIQSYKQCLPATAQQIQSASYAGSNAIETGTFTVPFNTSNGESYQLEASLQAIATQCDTVFSPSGPLPFQGCQRLNIGSTVKINCCWADTASDCGF